MKSKRISELPVDWRPQEMPSLMISHLARLLSKRTDEQLKAVGLTVSQLPVLAALKDGAELTQKELAEQAKVAQPSMAQLLVRMERDGLVQRNMSLTDGRMSLVSLTTEAQRRLEPGRETLRRIDDAVCSILNEDEQAMLTIVLRKLVLHAERKVESDTNQPITVD